MNVVLLPIYNRPEFLHFVVNSIVEARRYDEYKYVIVAEHSYDQRCKEIIGRIKSEMEIIERSVKFELTKNILEGMKYAFSKTDDYVIIIEDDVMVSKDFFEFTDYVNKNYNDDNLLSITGSPQWAHNSIKEIFKVHFYVPWGVSISKGMFDKYILQHCNDDYYQNRVSHLTNTFPNSAYGSKWTAQAGLIQRIREEHGLYCIKPSVARCAHIGLYGRFRPLLNTSFKSMSFEDRIKFLQDVIKDKDKMRSFGKYKDYWTIDDDHEWEELSLAN